MQLTDNPCSSQSWAEKEVFVYSFVFADFLPRSQIVTERLADSLHTVAYTFLSVPPRVTEADCEIDWK